MEQGKKYCIFCGAENKIDGRFCSKCGQSFDQKDDELQTYAKEKAKEKATDTIKEKAFDTFLEMLKKFLNSKAYGIILSLSIVAAAGNILIGGANDGVNEFTNDIPGVFVDGSVHGFSYNNTGILFENGITGYLKFDTDSVPNMIYLVGQTYALSDINVTVTGADGKIIRQDQLIHDDEMTEDYLVAIDDLYCTIETECNNLDENIVTGCKVVMNGPAGMKSYEEYENGVLWLKKEFADDGAQSYLYRISGYSFGANGEKTDFYTEESFFNGNGDLVKCIEMSDGVVVKITEREDYADGTYKYTYTSNGAVTGVNVFDTQGKQIQYHAYNNGQFMYKNVFEYYETGELMTEAYYAEENDVYPASVKYLDIDGNVTKETQHYTDTGSIQSETVYNPDGSSVFYEYYYDTGNLMRVTHYSIGADGRYVETESVAYDQSGNAITD